jgi:hypothetical protein
MADAVIEGRQGESYDEGEDGEAVAEALPSDGADAVPVPEAEAAALAAEIVADAAEAEVPVGVIEESDDF